MKNYFKLFSILILVYLFLISIGLMGKAFGGFGEGFARSLIEITSNPWVGLFIGILATSLVQSSSTTTSIVVGMVSSGALTISNAIPIVMGANVGTTVTCFIVALAHFGRREEFRRAVSSAAVLVFFCTVCAFFFLPLEIATGFLQKTADLMVGLFQDFGGITFISPLEAATKPVLVFIEIFLSGLNFLQGKWIYVLMLVLSLLLMFSSLFFIIKTMRSLVMGKVEAVLNSVFGNGTLIAIFFGFMVTALVQSSSITTSLMVPFVAAGILNIESVFPMFLGAKLGSTTTTILASFATGNIPAITVAFVHLLFSFFGAFFVYPIAAVRNFSLSLSHKLGNLAYKKRRYALTFMISFFFIIPGLVILIANL